MHEHLVRVGVFPLHVTHYVVQLVVYVPVVAFNHMGAEVLVNALADVELQRVYQLG